MAIHCWWLLSDPAHGTCSVHSSRAQSSGAWHLELRGPGPSAYPPANTAIENLTSITDDFPVWNKRKPPNKKGFPIAIFDVTGCVPQKKSRPIATKSQSPSNSPSSSEMLQVIFDDFPVVPLFFNLWGCSISPLPAPAQSWRCPGASQAAAGDEIYLPGRLYMIILSSIWYSPPIWDWIAIYWLVLRWKLNG